MINTFQAGVLMLHNVSTSGHFATSPLATSNWIAQTQQQVVQTVSATT